MHVAAAAAACGARAEEPFSLPKRLAADRMWYHAGWFDGIAYATSEEGIRWSRPNLDVEPGTNRVLAKRDGHRRDGATVWLDQEAAAPAQRFKEELRIEGVM